MMDRQTDMAGNTTTRAFELITVTAVAGPDDQNEIKTHINLHNFHAIEPEGRRLILDKTIAELQAQRDKILDG